jgi:hypothetical protein
MYGLNDDIRDQDNKILELTKKLERFRVENESLLESYSAIEHKLIITEEENQIKDGVINRFESAIDLYGSDEIVGRELKKRFFDIEREGL